MEVKEQVAQLETVFFSTLDALRGIWDGANAGNTLLSLVFYKRILALKEENQIDFIVTEPQDYAWATNFTNTVVENPDKATHELIQTLVLFSKRNERLKNIFTPYSKEFFSKIFMDH